MPVYFIQEQPEGRIKIGKSRNPKKRLMNLQTGNPDPLEVIACLPGGRVEETLLHQKLDRYRCTRGEWFHPTKGLLGYIRVMESALNGDSSWLGDRELAIYNACLMRGSLSAEDLIRAGLLARGENPIDIRGEVIALLDMESSKVLDHLLALRLIVYCKPLSHPHGVFRAFGLLSK